MQKITKATGVLVAVGILLAAAVSPAMAADAGSSAVDSSVTGGNLSATTAGATLSGVTLNGSNTQTAAGSSTEWTITDARGTGADWALSASASDFTSAIGTGTEAVDTTVRTIAATNLTITPGDITAGTGADTAPTAGAVAIATAGTAQALISATGPTKGTYTLTPTFSLAIPANAFRSNYTTGSSGALNPYTSTITYTIA